MKAKEVAMVIALAILSSLFFGLLVDAIYEQPVYENYCNDKYARPIYSDTKDCVFQQFRSEQVDIDKCYTDGGMPEFNYDEKGCQQGFKECNFCNKEFSSAQEKYNRNVFFILGPVGLILLIIGLFLSYEVVGTGLMFSGILVIAYSTIRYFSNMSKWFRVLVILIELILLILISIKKLRK